eukprot:44949-Prorocentrum_minimum.AAC.2
MQTYWDAGLAGVGKSQLARRCSALGAASRTEGKRLYVHSRSGGTPLPQRYNSVYVLVGRYNSVYVFHIRPNEQTVPIFGVCTRHYNAPLQVCFPRFERVP